MTAPRDDHDVAPSFAWDDRYRRQLEQLADTDEMTDDIRWPQLKEAIKFMLKDIFFRYPSSSAPILHPAASLMASNQQRRDLDKTSADSSGESSASSSASAEEASSASSSPTQEKNNAVAARMTMNGNGAGDPGVSSGSHGRENGASPFGKDAASALNARFAHAPNRSEVHVREADMQAFFPSKRQAPVEWGGSWGKRIETEAELDKERRMVFGMLDDFENQPPFTIQRLAELILRPTEHHHTLPKYISGLKRLLSVTATRDAFPATAAEEEEEEEDELDVQAGNAGAETLQNGSATPTSASASRSRSSSVAGSPRTAPLFSPIPFLMKSGDEGMPGAGSRVDGQGTFGRDTGMNVDDRDVPAMELGGADRTTEEAAEHALRTGAGVASSKAVHDAHDLVNGLQLGETAESIESTAPGEGSGATLQAAASHVNHQDVAASSTSTPMGSAGALANDTAGASSTPAGGNEPLGVPVGPVDEVDQIGEKHGQLQPLEPGSVAGGARAFSSTTTSTAPMPEAIATAPAIHGANDRVESAADENASLPKKPSAMGAEITHEGVDAVHDEGEQRALKRVRSDKDLGESKEL